MSTVRGDGGSWTGAMKARIVAGVGLAMMLFLGIAGRGDWILLLIHIIGPGGMNETDGGLHFLHGWSSEKTNEFLSQYNMQNVHVMTTISVMVSLVTFLPLCGWLHYFYYHKQRHQPEKWKCQPKKFLSKDNHRHEMTMGIINMTLGGTVSGLVATWIINGGYTSLYFSVDQHSWFYLAFSTVGVFLIQDGFAFYAHRTYHHPWLYKRIHKHHHRYHSPTPFSATAMHPLEFLTYQFALGAPAFFFPCYSGSFIVSLLYIYYYGVIDHSGIYMESMWPWQPSSLFHDNHHKYFHCNFGFNLKIWDVIHDSVHKSNRIYSEEIFGGRGRTPKNANIKAG